MNFSRFISAAAICSAEPRRTIWRWNEYPARLRRSSDFPVRLGGLMPAGELLQLGKPEAAAEVAGRGRSAEQAVAQAMNCRRDGSI